MPLLLNVSKIIIIICYYNQFIYSQKKEKDEGFTLSPLLLFVNLVFLRRSLEEFRSVSLERTHHIDIKIFKAVWEREYYLCSSLGVGIGIHQWRNRKEAV